MRRGVLISDTAMREQLKEKVEEADLALTLKMQEGKTPQWAAANTEYADALAALAAQEAEPAAFACYQQAIAAYEENTQIYTAESHSSEWLTTVCALARTLRAYGTRENGDKGMLHLETAKSRVKNALQTASNSKVENPIVRAALSLELAYACRACADIGRKENRQRNLQQTIAYYAEAGQIFKAKEQFENWANCLVGQAMAWRRQGETADETSADCFYRAIDLFKSALSFYNQNSSAKDRSYIHFEYGRTLLHIAGLLQDENRYEAAKAAVDALRVAASTAATLKALDFKLKLQNEFGLALAFLAQCPQTGNGVALLEEAVHLLQTAAEHDSAGNDPVDIACTYGNLGKSLIALADEQPGRQSQTYRLQAIDALRKSLTPALAGAWRQEWFANLVELGAACHLAANHEDTEQCLPLFQEAAEIYREALRHPLAADDPALRARLYGWLGLTLSCLGEYEEGATEKAERLLKEAERSFRLAITICQEQNIMADYGRLQSNIGNVFYLMARHSDDATAAAHLNAARQAMQQAINSLAAESVPAEWATAQWNYALILKHSLIRGASQQVEADFTAAAQALHLALAARPVEEDAAGHMEIKRARASLLLIQAQILPGRDKTALKQALTLTEEIHQWANTRHHSELAAQTRADLAAIRESLARSRPQSLISSIFNRLRRFF